LQALKLRDATDFVYEILAKIQLLQASHGVGNVQNCDQVVAQVEYSELLEAGKVFNSQNAVVVEVEDVEIWQHLQILNRLDRVLAQIKHSKVLQRCQLADFIDLVLREVEKGEIWQACSVLNLADIVLRQDKLLQLLLTLEQRDMLEPTVLQA